MTSLIAYATLLVQNYDVVLVGGVIGVCLWNVRKEFVWIRKGRRWKV